MSVILIGARRDCLARSSTSSAQRGSDEKRSDSCFYYVFVLVFIFPSLLPRDWRVSRLSSSDLARCSHTIRGPPFAKCGPSFQTRAQAQVSSPATASRRPTVVHGAIGAAANRHRVPTAPDPPDFRAATNTTTTTTTII